MHGGNSFNLIRLLLNQKKTIGIIKNKSSRNLQQKENTIPFKNLNEWKHDVRTVKKTQ